MSKLKSKREYAIRLVFPEVGEYYLSRIEKQWSKCTYLFTSELTKVQKWKTKNKVDDIIKKISESKNSIYLLLGTETNLLPKYKDNISFSMNKYRFLIKDIMTKENIDKIRSDINGLDAVLLEDLSLIADLIQYKKIDKDTFVFLKKFEKDIHLYRILNGYSIFDDNKYIDIVDASYGFRYLKLKALNEKVEI